MLRKGTSKAQEEKIVALVAKGDSWQVKHETLLKIDKRLGKVKGAERAAFRKAALDRFPHSAFFKSVAAAAK